MVEDTLSQQREHARVPRNHYRSSFIQARGVLKKELVQHLRSKRLIRRSRHSRVDGQSRGQIVDAISIRQRPAEIEDRAIPGHWEGDLLAGTRKAIWLLMLMQTVAFSPSP
jgi:IS30 family transposase